MRKDRRSGNGYQKLGVTTVRINDSHVKSGQTPVMAIVKCVRHWQNGGPLGALGPFYQFPIRRPPSEKFAIQSYMAHSFIARPIGDSNSSVMAYD